MKKEEKKHCTYILLDPTKSGNFEYGKTYNSKFRPIYVGSGRNERWKDHLNCKDTRGLYSREYLQKEIKRIREIGKEPIIEALTGITRKEGFKWEIKLIQAIGRKDLKTGPLLNKTDGGEGPSNLSLKTRKRISKAQKKRWQDPEYHKKMIRVLEENDKKFVKKIRRGDFVQRGSKNGMSKLTEKKVLEIRDLYKTGQYFQRELAEIFNVSITSIRRITQRIYWTHI